MSGPGYIVVACLAFFWALVFVWVEAGFSSAIAVAALCDLGITLYARRAERQRLVKFRRREGS